MKMKEQKFNKIKFQEKITEEIEMGSMNNFKNVILQTATNIGKKIIFNNPGLLKDIGEAIISPQAENVLAEISDGIKI
jgi:hypothetical protein